LSEPDGDPPPAPREHELETVVLASADSSEGFPRTHGEDTPRPLARATAAAVAAVPASRLTSAEPSPARAAEPARPGPEPPAVRVHIGRLEVRANLQAPPRVETGRRRSEAVEPALSLSDYLRRSRGAR
jgi:hypothetical protein